MSTTLEKVRRLEQYIAGEESAAVDPVLEMTVEKLLTREISRMQDLKVRLAEQLHKFEQQYGLQSPDFYQQYERGQLGDLTDFVEWSATVEMLANTEDRLRLLQNTASS